MKLTKLDGSILEFPVIGNVTLQDVINHFNLPEGMSYRDASGKTLTTSSDVLDSDSIYVTPVVKAG